MTRPASAAPLEDFRFLRRSTGDGAFSRRRVIAPRWSLNDDLASLPPLLKIPPGLSTQNLRSNVCAGTTLSSHQRTMVSPCFDIPAKCLARRIRRSFLPPPPSPKATPGAIFSGFKDRPVPPKRMWHGRIGLLGLRLTPDKR